MFKGVPQDAGIYPNFCNKARPRGLAKIKMPGIPILGIYDHHKIRFYSGAQEGPQGRIY
jgi:hypothetical protein